jgi:SAM-dependent methyltransferase
MNYYKNFKIVIGTPLWRLYLHWAYKKCLEDFNKLNFSPDFKERDFTALLCGVGNETTADEFIKFTLQRNKKAKIIIIDLGKEQVEAVKRLIREKYSSFDIVVKQMNALDLNTYLKSDSIDWIETDGFLEYFDKDSLNKLLKIWHKLLKPDGFITLRETGSRGWMGNIIDKSRIWIGKVWLGVRLYQYNSQQLTSLFKKTGFKYVETSTFIPTFNRYSLIKD